MTRHRFYQLDVFTDHALRGNPLAVFPDADGLAGETMQALAREMNLSETTFVLPSTEATKRLRIFTPGGEVPLAGHPVIGTWWLLAELGIVPNGPVDGETTVTQETGRGVLPVAIAFAGGRPARVTMTQASPEFGATVSNRKALARALGADVSALAERPAPQVVSTALPQLMVPIATRKALAALPAGGTGGELAAYLRALGTDCVMCYVATRTPDGAEVFARMFAPGLGVPEDPATGSASGALGAYLVTHGLAGAAAGTTRITVRQGIEMGRASTIHVEVTTRDGAVTTVKVGGTAVRIIEGEVTL